MNFQERKAARRDHYARLVHGWKIRRCGACNGSGRYDNHGSPPCGSCDGTGKERYKPDPAHPLIHKSHFYEFTKGGNLTEVFVTLDNGVYEAIGIFDLRKKFVTPRHILDSTVEQALRVLGPRRET